MILPEVVIALVKGMLIVQVADAPFKVELDDIVVANSNEKDYIITSDSPAY